ncbi:MAG: hypothetical protein ACRDE2_17360, partial [Chitinophagaceae bacterium]
MDTQHPAGNITELLASASQKMVEEAIKSSPETMSDNIEMALHYSNLFSELASNKESMAKVQKLFADYIKKHQDLWKSMMERKDINGNVPVIAPAPYDKRFKAAEWNEIPYFDFIKQSYLLISEVLNNVVDSADIDTREKKKLLFYTRQYIDAISPTNFLATNPEAIKLAQETNGQSITDGIKNFLEDVVKGKITQTDTSAFELGKNLAITAGSVIYENELIQLIQYKPSTPKVYETP